MGRTNSGVLLSMTKTCSPLQNPPQCTAGREDVVRNYDVPGERADTRYGGRVEGTGGGVGDAGRFIGRKPHSVTAAPPTTPDAQRHHSGPNFRLLLTSIAFTLKQTFPCLHDNMRGTLQQEILTLFIGVMDVRG